VLCMHRFCGSVLLRGLLYKGKMRGNLRVCPLLLAVGAERFKAQIETVLARSVRPGQAGRKKTTGGLSGEQESLRFEERAK